MVLLGEGNGRLEGGGGAWTKEGRRDLGGVKGVSVSRRDSRAEFRVRLQL